MAFKYRFLRALKSAGKPSTEPMRSAMASSGEDWCPAGGAARCKRSRTMSDFEHPRPRDSDSIPATRDSGNRTVRVLMEISVLRRRHACKTEPGFKHVQRQVRKTTGRKAGLAAGCQAKACPTIFHDVSRAIRGVWEGAAAPHAGLARCLRIRSGVHPNPVANSVPTCPEAAKLGHTHEG